MEEVQIPIKNKLRSEKKSEEPKKKTVAGELFSVIGILILAPLIALFLTFFVFQSYVVDGPSMENTLHDQDRLIVWKASKTLNNITNNDFIPDRYAIIVFHERAVEAVASKPEDKQLIKRVIGLPGDRVVISKGTVTIYNQDHRDGFYPDKEISDLEFTGSTGGEIDYTVKPGEVYVLGDNRPNSLDSRVFGPIKSDDIVGTLAVRIYPFDKVEKF